MPKHSYSDYITQFTATNVHMHSRTSDLGCQSGCKELTHYYPDTRIGCMQTCTCDRSGRWHYRSARVLSATFHHTTTTYSFLGHRDSNPLYHSCIDKLTHLEDSITVTVVIIKTETQVHLSTIYIGIGESNTVRDTSLFLSRSFASQLS